MVPATNQGGMGNQGMVVTQAPVREPRDPMAVPMVSPVPMQMVSPVPMAQASRMSPPPAGYDPTGGNQRMLMDPAAHAVEEIRLRVTREAEEAFAREVRRLQQTAEETQSYQSASSGAGVGTGIGQTMGVPQPVGGGRTSPPRGMGGTPLPPPGLAATGNGTVSGSLSEALRTLELPKLPTPGGENASLQFGDWLTVVFPLMSDVSGTASDWWSSMIQAVESHYAQWLVASPLEKLRMRPTPPVHVEANQRLEQRAVTMLLGALPEALRQDVIASRRMTTTGIILFRLFTTYQPGGAGERTGLIKSISEVKVPAGLGDLLGSIRQWRRSLGRSYELRVTIDPLVLTGVLSKFAEGTGKLGGSQVAFRLASMRQQLDVDRTPGWESVNDWAEYIQAELEELANAQVIAGKATPSNPPALAPVLTQGNPAVKALYGDGQKPWERPDGEKAPCRFWGTDEGCRRGEKCTFAHAWGSLEKSSRCLLCSSTKHRKKRCPTVKPKDGNGGAQRGDRKIAKTQEKKGPKGSQKEGQKETPPSQPAKEAAEETPQREKRSEGSQPKESDLVQNLSGLVKADGDDSGEFALLDGGATHALRQAKSSEVPHLWPVQVEMAMGSVTLYKCPAHNTLLALDSVEPIIPLRLLADHGFKIEWQRDRCDISHPKHGRLECVRRQGCPVMERQAALNLLDSLERGGVGDTYMSSLSLKWNGGRSAIHRSLRESGLW